MGVADDHDTGSGDEAPGTDATTTATTTGTSTGSTPSDDSTDGGHGFITPLGDVPSSLECNLFEQDCPRGEKCTPWANDGGTSWNATRCSPLVDDPGQPGDPCMFEGNPANGSDTCGVGMMCWDIDLATLEGICWAMCTGSMSNPTCEDPDSTCQATSDGFVQWCLSWCSPLEQDCAAGRACYPLGSYFECAPDGSGDTGIAGDPCELDNQCDPGLMCADAELVPDCAGAAGCCSPYCSIEDPMPPCLPGQVCAPYYDVGTAPPGYEAVGLCVLP